MDGIKLLQPQGSIVKPNSTVSPDISKSESSFEKSLQDAMAKVNDLQLKADKAAQDLATGRSDNIADVMIAAEKADIALRLMMQMRNKMIEGYQEVMKIQV